MAKLATAVQGDFSFNKPEVAQEHFLWTMLAPCSSYSSLLIQDA